MITKIRRILLTQITSGAIDVLPPISHIAIGDGGLDDNGDPKQTVETQVELFNEIARYPIHELTYPIETTARYSITIPENDLVGARISEIGLIDAYGNLCAIKTMFEKVKDDLVLFTFEFDDEF